jgi:hypothetical protein
MKEPSTSWLVTGGVVLCGVLVWAGLQWPQFVTGSGGAADAVIPGLPGLSGGPHTFRPFVELAKLISAALIGLAVTTVHQRYPGDRPITRTMAQSQMLLCVAGAMMMIIIGNSVARALGIAGGASLIRFRTPVDDPKDTTVLFLQLGLGMACGLGAFAVAGLATGFTIVFLILLDRVGEAKARAMMVDIAASGSAFPVSHVQDCFRRHEVVFEPREVEQDDDESSVRYRVVLGEHTSLYHLNQQLMAEGTGLKSVSWHAPKRRDDAND